MSEPYEHSAPLPKILNLTMVLCITMWMAALFFTNTLPDHTTIDPELLQAPAQMSTEREPFDFSYREETYQVQPVAEYEMWGVIVSHNNIESFSDIYHDENSVDLKDICIAWGPMNLKSNDLHEVEFWSNSWTCNFRYDRQLQFDPYAISNNHLLASDPTIQEQIKNLHIGDQIRIQGLLINYHPESNPNWSRNTSTVRTDTGDGACEVVFVEEVEILSEGTPLWFAVKEWSKTIFLLALALRILFFFWHSKKESEAFDQKVQQ